jgi:hypothetical protein
MLVTAFSLLHGALMLASLLLLLLLRLLRVMLPPLLVLLAKVTCIAACAV